MVIIYQVLLCLVCRVVSMLKNKTSGGVCVCVQALKCVVLYLVLAPYGNEQSDLIHRVKEDKCLEQIPKYRYKAASVLTTLSRHFICQH